MSKGARLNFSLAVTAALVFAAIGAGPITSADAVPIKTSSGKVCTIVGTAGADVLVGTSKNDVVCGLGGNDVITGQGGNDIVDGGSGNDTIAGGLGNDTIAGGSGSDKINGDEGNDRLLGGTGNDEMYGDLGSDGLIGGDGSDILSGSDVEPEPEEKNLCERDVNDQVSYCGFDNSAPWVVSIAMSKTEVDASSANQSVELTIRVTDDLMGFASGDCSLQHENSRVSDRFSTLKRISGDAIDGVYKCTGTIAAQSAHGLWGLVLRVTDAVENGGGFTQGPDGNVDYGPKILDLPANFWIMNVGRGDTYSPRITEPALSKTSVNTAVADRAISVSMTISDDFSGIDEAGCQLTRKGIEWPNQGKYGGALAKLSSGTKNKGNWTCTMLMPKNSSQGIWTIWLFATDKSGKEYYLNSSPDDPYQWVADDIQSWDRPPNVISRKKNFITQVAPGDDSPPIPQSISITPTAVNASSNSQTITAKLTFAPDQGFIGAYGIWFSLINEQTQAPLPMFCTQTQTQSKGFVFDCTSTLKRGSASGNYYGYITATDAMGIRGDYKGNRCTGDWVNVSSLENLGKIGPLGIYNGVGEAPPYSGTQCVPN